MDEVDVTGMSIPGRQNDRFAQRPYFLAFLSDYVVKMDNWHKTGIVFMVGIFKLAALRKN